MGAGFSPVPSFGCVNDCKNPHVFTKLLILMDISKVGTHPALTE
jgi:hypothetical protein